MKLVFISSLNFSGSTLLDLLLSCHSNVYGIGEVDAVLDEQRREKHLAEVDTVECTCGKIMEECELWGPYTSYLKQNPDESHAVRYRKMLDLLREQHGDDIVVTDSSKYLVPLNKLIKDCNELGLKPSDIYVIHLMKDVRSFATSMKRSNNTSSFGEFGVFKLWHQFNRQVSEVLENSTVNHMQIGYEEICLYPDHSLKLLCDFIGIKFEPEMKELKNSKSHLALGNVMRLDKKKSAQIFYDNRWFLEESINFKYWLMFWIRKYNEKHVYGNTIVNQKGPRFRPH